MWWRLRASDWKRGKGEPNRKALRRIVQGGEVPGLLAYAGDEPVGWCALAPRERYRRLATSRALAPVDDRPVWSVSCFFVARPWRRRGVTRELLRAAARHAGSRGARLLEGYPVATPKGAIPAVWAWTGFESAFRAAGFREAARRSPSRPIMRRTLRPSRPASAAGRRR
jgi:GNAT superfamily N-acetyltransferase